MDELMQKLQDYGADIEGIMNRFLNDVDLYHTCYKAFLTDESFASLGEAIKIKDYKMAFESAHTLKGITGNMGLTPLYKLVCALVEDLRKFDYSTSEPLYAQIMNQLTTLKNIKQ